LWYILSTILGSDSVDAWVTQLTILVDTHTLERAEERGATKDEIEDVIATGFPIPAKHGRLRKAKVFRFDAEWNGKHYEEKRVEVIYIHERGAIVTVTVYVFFGQWEKKE
jgi:hypothetical protein